MTKTKNNLQEISAQQLIQTGNRVQNNHVEDPGWGIDGENIHWAYEAGTKRLLFWGLYEGKENTYPFKIDFLRVDAEEVTSPEDLEQVEQKDFAVNIPYPQPDGRILFVTDYNRVFLINPINSRTTDVQVRCGCPSYRFSYYTGNKHKKAATGANFPPYIPNGRGTKKPIAAGACKHLQLIINALIEQGIIK